MLPKPRPPNPGPLHTHTPPQVVGIQALSAASRGTAAFPPQPHPLAGGSAASAAAAAASGDDGSLLRIPRCLDPLEVLVTLENSGEP